MKIRSGRVCKAFLIVGIAAVVLFPACPVPENELVNVPVQTVEILKNQESVPGGVFSILEGRQVVLSARLGPAGVSGGIHWQDSCRRIVELSAYTGQEIIVTGSYGGDTDINVLARNPLSEVAVEAGISIKVIPKSFLKWDFLQDTLVWEEIEPDSPAVLFSFPPSKTEATSDSGAITVVKEMLVRSGHRTIVKDDALGGFVLEGPDASMAIGSVLVSPTNSTFSDSPAYDAGGMFNFAVGPSVDYPFYRKRVQIAVDYTVLSASSAGHGLRIQINNNTGERINAAAIDNWLLTELDPGDTGGTVTAIFDAGASKLNSLKAAEIPGITDEEKLETVLSSSFICLWLPEGKILVRGIRVESAD